MPGRGLLLDVPQLEGGTEVLAGRDDIDIALVEVWADLDDKFAYLARGKHPYKWVAIDSVTALQKLAKRKVIKEREISADPHKTTLEEFGKINSLVEEVVYRFRTLPIFTIWIAQERRFSSEDEASIWGPDVQPGALNIIMPSMMLVARYKASTTLEGVLERHLYIAPRPDTYAKYRAAPDLKVPAIIKDVNLADVIRYLNGNKEVTLHEVTDDSVMTIELED